MTKRKSLIILSLAAAVTFALALLFMPAGNKVYAAETLYSGEKTVYVKEDKIYKTAETGAEQVDLKLAMRTGAAVRLIENPGLRFTSGVEKTGYDALGAAQTNVKFGTLVGPARLNPDGITLGSPADNFVNIACSQEKSWYDATLNAGDAGESWCFNAALVDINPKNYGNDYVAQSYMTITYADGATETVYAAKTAEGANTRSIKAVSASALADTEAGYGEEEKATLNKYANRKESVKVSLTPVENDNGTSITATTDKGAEWLLSSTMYDSFVISDNVEGHTLLTFEMLFENGVGSIPYAAHIQADTLDSGAYNKLLWGNTNVNIETNGMLVYTTEKKELTGVMVTYGDEGEADTSDYSGQWLTVQYVLPVKTNNLKIRFEGRGKLYLRNIVLSDATQAVMPEQLSLGVLKNNFMSAGQEFSCEKTGDITKVAYGSTSSGNLTLAKGDYGYSKFEMDIKADAINKQLAIAAYANDIKTEYKINGNDDWNNFANYNTGMQVRLINADGTYGALVNPLKEDARFLTDWVHLEILLPENTNAVEFKATDYMGTAFSFKNAVLNKETTLEEVTERAVSYKQNSTEGVYDAATGAYSNFVVEGYDLALASQAKDNVSAYNKIGFDIRIDETTYPSIMANGKHFIYRYDGDGNTKFANLYDNMQVREINADGTYGKLIDPDLNSEECKGAWYHVEFIYSGLEQINIHYDGAIKTTYIKNVTLSTDYTFETVTEKRVVYGGNNANTPVWSAADGAYKTYGYSDASSAMPALLANVDYWTKEGRGYENYSMISFDLCMTAGSIIHLQVGYKKDGADTYAKLPIFKYGDVYGNLNENMMVREINADGTYGAAVNPDGSNLNKWYRVDMIYSGYTDMFQLCFSYDGTDNSALFKNVSVSQKTAFDAAK